MEKELKEASYYKKLGESVQCALCPHFCFIKQNEVGKCYIRKNINGVLYSLTYEKPAVICKDPIEKKPLYHFLPGTKSFSIGMAGCNMQCGFCQNWDLSQRGTERNVLSINAEEIVSQVKDSKCPSISYTYSEPLVSYEYMLDIAKIARGKKIKNVMVTNGFINQEPLKELCKYIDASNIDLKSINNDFYDITCKAKLEPVLETIKTMHKKGIWIELTNLIIPGLNDSEKDIRNLVLWVKNNLEADVPLHFSGFFPNYKMRHVEITSKEMLRKAREIAVKEGIHYVYTGNVLDEEGNNTYCHKCKKLLIERRGFMIIENKIKKGKCPYCEENIPGVWQ